ncbi:hypothetical protein CC2G_011727 [Coprinopsis cinerea AmutBmut pab1-1]|nr:hypothetical protein CC2G_011727 [Coprinopsis cinerea AmutBmut pab1-1]
MAEAQRAYLQDLPAEIFEAITNQLPVYATPSTVLSLSLVNQEVFGRVFPLVYTHVIVNGVDSAVNVLGHLKKRPELAEKTRSIHIEAYIDYGEPDHVIFEVLGDLVTSGALSNLRTLELSIHDEDKPDSVEDYCTDTKLWDHIHKHCPHLSAIVLKGSANLYLSDGNPMQSIDLRISQKLCRIVYECENEAFLNHIARGRDDILKSVDAASMHLRHLDLVSVLCELTLPRFFDITLPNLESLNIRDSPGPDAKLAHTVMAFWRKHRNLSQLTAWSGGTQKGQWFFETDPPSGVIFPRLNYLECNFHDALLLSDVLPQLQALHIHESYNSQVPYLLRAKTSSGILPNLKSLGIAQTPMPYKQAVLLKGAVWRESEDGQFHENDGKVKISSWQQDYLRSVARAAPNLEELAFLSGDVPLQKIVCVPHNAQRLRFY